MDDIVLVIACDSAARTLLERRVLAVDPPRPIKKLDMPEVFIVRDDKPKITKRQWRESLRING